MSRPQITDHGPQTTDHGLPPVSSSYGRPFVDWLARLDAVCSDEELPLSVFKTKVAALADELSVLSMDWVALGNHLEAAMGQAALRGALEKSSVIGVNGVNGVTKPSAFSLLMFAADPFQLPRATFAPLAEAVAKLDSRTPVASKLSSLEWSRVALELRERAFFSARVENIRFLAEAQKRLHDRLALSLENKVNRGSFILDMRQIAEEEGIDTTDPPDQRGTIRDIRSTARLGLIYDMQTSMAQEYARWHMDHDADVLDAYPAQRFERVESRRNPRPDGFWESRWAEAGNACGWQGAMERPMVALKTSPIWQGLSIFGTPWPPFDWGSGWGIVDVDREESDNLGLTRPALPVPEFDQGSGRAIDAETGKVTGFNDVLEASVRDWRPDQFATLKGAFGDQVRERGGAVQWVGNLISDLFRNAAADPQYKGTISLGNATEETIRKAAPHMDVVGYKMNLTADDIRHAMKHHGETEQRKDQRPLTAAEFAVVPHVWRDPDSVTLGEGAQKPKEGTLEFRKNILGEQWVIGWNRDPKSKAFFVNSVWIKRKGGSSDVGN